MKMKIKKDYKDTTQIDLGQDMYTNIVNIRSASWCSYVLSNT